MSIVVTTNDEIIQARSISSESNIQEEILTSTRLYLSEFFIASDIDKLVNGNDEYKGYLVIDTGDSKRIMKRQQGYFVNGPLMYVADVKYIKDAILTKKHIIPTSQPKLIDQIKNFDMAKLNHIEI